MIKNFQNKLLILFFALSIHLMADSNNNCRFMPSTSDYSRYVTFDSSSKKPTFENNTVNWYFNTISYQGFNEYQKKKIIKIIKKAMLSWSKYGNIKFIYKGESVDDIQNIQDKIIMIGYMNEYEFNDVCGEGNSGCAKSVWNINKVIYDGFVAINSKYYHRFSDMELQGLFTHEIAHLLGIDHSNDKDSIMYATPYHSNLYQAKLRKDDIDVINLLYPYPQKWNTGRYNNNEIKTQKLSINNANSIRVKAIGITERNYDYISFFDIRGKKLQTFSGVINESFIVNGSYVKAVLVSDDSQVGAGVDISITAENKN